jgi:hypothetical protein
VQSLQSTRQLPLAGQLQGVWSPLKAEPQVAPPELPELEEPVPELLVELVEEALELVPRLDVAVPLELAERLLPVELPVEFDAEVDLLLVPTPLVAPDVDPVELDPPEPEQAVKHNAPNSAIQRDRMFFSWGPPTTAASPRRRKGGS